MMDQQEQKTMETLLDLFQHDGWTIFIDELDNQLKQLKEHAYIECDSNEQWQQRRGLITVLSQVVSYENTIKIIASQNDDPEDEL